VAFRPAGCLTEMTRLPAPDAGAVKVALWFSYEAP
jgi:hypothetical protein